VHAKISKQTQFIVWSTRPQARRKAIAFACVGILLDAVASVGEPVRPAFLWRSSLRDADDDMVLEVAVNGQADAIVTFNRRDFRPATERFGIEVLLPGAAIERLGGIS
jgi:predicted nucleic acid-binding protein